ncbi:MAG: hypothetical protein IMZ53_02860 [Thermoplasmata archaeon]|nr:hypothetical protein [Thermoplasmata archaeon]
MLTDTEIKKLYERFVVKDMPFNDFKRKFKELTDPARMARDLQDIKLGKKVGV